MPELKQLFSGLDPELTWILQIFIIVLATAVVAYVLRRVLVKMEAKATLTKNRWDDTVIRAMRRPVSWVVWLEGLDITYADISADVSCLDTLTNIDINYKPINGSF